MKILITGVCGTTGTSLSKYLLKNSDDTIVGVDNFYKPGSKLNLIEIMDTAAELGAERFSFNCLDITEPTFFSFLDSIRPIDQVYNLAAIVETPRFYDSPYETYSVNCRGAIDLFNWAVENNVDRFVNASSSEIYGHPAEFPIKETTVSTYDSVDVSTRWSYAHGKILTEYVLNQLADKGTTKVCHLRYANVYGENDINPVHVIPYLITCIFNNKDIVVSENYKIIRRSFLHNEDSTLGTVFAMKNMINKHSYNIGSDREVTIEQLIGLCEQACFELSKKKWSGKILNTLHRPGDPVRRILDTTRAKAELGFSTQITLEQGIKNTAERIFKNMSVD